MAYPLEYLEVSNLCSRLERIRRGQPKYPAEYYDLRNEYHATKDKNGLRYSYVYAHGFEDGVDTERIETVGRQDIGYVIENTLDHSRYVIHFGPRFPSAEEITLNNTLAMKGIRPFIYEIGMVESEEFYALDPRDRRDNNNKRRYQEKNEDGKLMWYWITDYYVVERLLDEVCKNANNIESAYNMFAITLPILHSKNYIIPKFEMKQMFSGFCSNYKDDAMRSLMCVCPFKRWFYYPDERYVRGQYVISNPEERHVSSYIHNQIVRVDFSRYSSVRTDESSLVEPLDNWMSVMFIMLDVMGTFMPDCILFDNNYTQSKFRIGNKVDVPYDEVQTKFLLNYHGTAEMYSYLLNKYMWMHEMPSVTINSGRSFEKKLKNKIRLMKNWKKEFVKYINWMLLNYNNNINAEYIKNNIEDITKHLANGNPFEVDAVKWNYYNLFVTCIGYLSMISQFKRNYVDVDFMQQIIPQYIHLFTILYTCYVTYGDDKYNKLLFLANPNVNFPVFKDVHEYAQFIINNDVNLKPVMFNIDIVGERESYDRLVTYTCINGYKYPVVQDSSALTAIMDNVMGININMNGYTFENENDNDYLRRMNSLASRIVNGPELGTFNENADPRYYKSSINEDTVRKNLKKYTTAF